MAKNKKKQNEVNNSDSYDLNNTTANDSIGGTENQSDVSLGSETVSLEGENEMSHELDFLKFQVVGEQNINPVELAHFNIIISASEPTIIPNTPDTQNLIEYLRSCDYIKEIEG
jgi:hypothetical protein